MASRRNCWIPCSICSSDVEDDGDGEAWSAPGDNLCFLVVLLFEAEVFAFDFVGVTTCSWAFSYPFSTGFAMVFRQQKVDGRNKELLVHSDGKNLNDLMTMRC
jgi:hypothetical protein